ncbi:MAG: hypothetical protein COB53_00395 [Elusimicrobia bacterium]|nr:MAG: hypothetical protein COB53_00395 [Elusimicrobiota bacterium]
MIKINLVPQEILNKEVQKQRMVQVGFVAGFFFLVFAGISFKHYYKGVTLANELEDKEAKFKKLEKIVTQVEALEQQAKAVRGRLDVIGSLDEARAIYPRVMTDLLSTFPRGVYINSLGTVSDGMKVTLSMGAVALDSEAVSDWYRTLEISEKFSGQKLGSLTLSPEGKVNFSMSVKYAYAKPGKGKS